MYTEDYIVNSLELHLFFGRIMKEHSFFLKAGFTPANSAFSRRAEFYQKEFEKLLCQAIALSDGVISREVLCSGELVTEFTALAEKQTENFTGITINRGITNRELMTSADEFAKEYAALLSACQHAQDQTLTSDSLQETIRFKDFKTAGVQGIEQCKIRSIILPLLADHVLREANHFIRLLQS